MDVRIKRAYEPAAASDGGRILIDRIWPRGVTREEAQLDEWARELAPSTELRRWFAHDPARFGEPTAVFHDKNARRLARWPDTLLTTATHDTKRGEDVRARINVLSEVPELWSAEVRRWRAIARRFLGLR